MACASVLRKRSSDYSPLAEVSPAKRLLSTSGQLTPLTRQPSQHEVMLVVNALSRCLSQPQAEDQTRGQVHGQTQNQISGHTQGQIQAQSYEQNVNVTSRKRKRQASPDVARKRLRRSPPEYSKPEVAAGPEPIAPASEPEAMDTDDVIAREVTSAVALSHNNSDSPGSRGAGESTSEMSKTQKTTIETVSQGAAVDDGTSSGTGAAVEGAEARAVTTGGEVDARFEEDLELICEIHPEVDPHYIREQLLLLINDPQRVSTVTFDLYSHKDLPQRAEREAREEALRERKRLQEMPFDVDTFVARYPQPMATFDVTGTTVTEHYYDHASAFLRNTFPLMQVTYIEKRLQHMGFHLTPTYTVLKAETKVHEDRKFKSRRDRTRFRSFPRPQQYEYPEEPDEEFYWERLFIQNKDTILEHIRKKEEAARLKYEAAKEEGRLRDCSVCLSSDLFLEDMATCSGGEHLFCRQCIQQSTSERLGLGAASFPCLETDCPCSMPLAGLEATLEKATYSLVLRRIQVEELQLAQIDGLVTCPFCPYAVVIPDDNTSIVFHCENPDCLEDSCRKCRQLSHIPMTCDEFKKIRQETMRNFVANEMAESIIRMCPKCSLRFIKDAGCNHMTCPNCRTSICYLCRQIISYKHFRRGQCISTANIEQLHAKEVQTAYEQSKDKFIEQHPELATYAQLITEDDELRALDPSSSNSKKWGVSCSVL